MSFMKDATLKELRQYAQLVATPSELQRIPKGFLEPRVSKQPWAGISERFQRKSQVYSSNSQEVLLKPDYTLLTLLLTLI